MVYNPAAEPMAGIKSAAKGFIDYEEKPVYERVMVDIETMSTSNHNALILSVGALRFDIMPMGPCFGDEFKMVLDPMEQIYLGRQVDRSTQKWWASQPPEAAEHWVQEDQWSLDSFKGRFADFLKRGNDGHGASQLWANGVVFDIGNLASLWPDGDQPWLYNVVRDARTIYGITPRDPSRKDPEPGAYGPAHCPLADCRYQVHRLWQHWGEQS